MVLKYNGIEIHLCILQTSVRLTLWSMLEVLKTLYFYVIILDGYPTTTYMYCLYTITYNTISLQCQGIDKIYKQSYPSVLQ